MNITRAALLAVTLISLATLGACSSKSEASKVTELAPTALATAAPAAAPVAAPVIEAPTQPVAAPLALTAGSSLERATAMGSQDRLPAGKWQVGKNYELLVPAQPTNVAPGKVEVVEAFWYGCSHCYELEPFMASWLKKKPGNIEFARLPVTWNPITKIHAQLFYTLQSLKRDDLHGEIFDTIFRKNNQLAGRDPEAALEVQTAWAKEHGIEPQAFADAYNSMWVATKMRQADELMRRYRIEGTPRIIVNGKYSTDVGMAGGHEQLLALINDLASAETRR